VREADGEVGLAGAGRPEEHHVGAFGDEVEGAFANQRISEAAMWRGGPG
jgi:hypothetical protein